jgi:uncharacterized membrane protein
MLKAVLTWIFHFGISALLARGSASQWALQLTIPFRQYDNDTIYNQIKNRVFTMSWLICAIISSTFISSAMLVDEVPALLLIVCGTILTVTQTSIQGYKLFRVALLEMGLPWPPDTGN